MIESAKTEALLRPWLGVRILLQANDLTDTVTRKLNWFRIDRDDPGTLVKALDSLIFMTVRNLTLGKMQVKLDNGSVMRIKVDDFKLLADELLYLPLSAAPKTAVNYHIIREYAMREDSLSALRALYLDFSAFQNHDEILAVAHVIRSCHASFRWRGWLDYE